MNIKIVSMPAGQAPEWVRQAWIGLILPTTSPRKPVVSSGVLGGEPGPSNIDDYQVKTDTAIKKLRKKNPEAAKWWEDNTPWLLGPGHYFRFGKRFCEVVRRHA